jgi:creatinine amidohydrolase/Fe(II)-dependent formamide hydrolase-like protein
MTDRTPSSDLEKSTAANHRSEGLESLLVFDRLEVGPVRVEPRRLIAPYRVAGPQGESSNELIYRYEERVFNPDDAADQNLAAMIAAQVALNYGLFCRRIVFNGLYDADDRRFLRTMAENTAREIYVMKFLAPNPFLVGPAAQLSAQRRPAYLQARLEFTQPRGGRPTPAWKLWPTRKDRYCVLSSGGKDSLLSFGLLDDVVTPAGRAGEVHPIFVNESGRHWFTALNAYRHFRDEIPHTARVWVNSDRIFAWMLRQMPFVRKDFADLRTDEYPIRLWTVAVFLFGVLPLMRKRQIGRLVVGDEFDTTQRARHAGIAHYAGLYDQSIFFDQALSRYFLQKGWSINQFSILRPLSELLIEKTLVERYPRLQQHQLSCHAALKSEDKVLPCGRCEKCRRIVGMLSALGADPGRCGYSPAQIEACLAALATKGVHQEAAGAEHLRHLLQQKGLLPPTPGGRPAKAHPEVLQLRFDKGHSPLNALPEDLRQPLLKILLAYADGAVEQQGRRFVAFDAEAALQRAAPYPFDFESAAKGSAEDARALKGASEYLWGELTWPEAGERLAQVDIALLPVGAIEQHGPHLPLDTDAFDAQYLARRVAEACSQPRPLVVPLVPFGVSYHHDDFKGTLSIRCNTLSQLVYDLGMSLRKNGIRKIVIINGHGGNDPALNYAAQMIHRDAGIFVCVDSGESSDVDIEALALTPNDVHAGEIETSTSLAVRPHLVRMDLAREAVPQFSSPYLNFTSRRGVAWYAHTRRISPSGVMGDPTKADARKGKQIWEIMTAHLVKLVEDLKALSLDEIHQEAGE